MSYFQTKQALKRTIQDLYQSDDRLDDRLSIFHTRNKKPHSTNNVKQMAHYAKMIQMAKDLKEINKELRNLAIQRINRLID